LKAKFEQKIADQNTYGMEEVNDMMKDAKEIKTEKANEINHGEVNHMIAKDHASEGSSASCWGKRKMITPKSLDANYARPTCFTGAP
jgi:hypothetical protein